jgi:hypothetical protein
VIGLWLIERKEDSFTARVRDIRISRDAELRDMRHTIIKRATRNGEIEIKLPIFGVVWIERHSEQPLLASGDQSGESEKGSWDERPSGQVENSDLAVLLHNK